VALAMVQIVYVDPPDDLPKKEKEDGASKTVQNNIHNMSKDLTSWS
jgi:hypothetical protein